MKKKVFLYFFIASICTGMLTDASKTSLIDMVKDAPDTDANRPAFSADQLEQSLQPDKFDLALDQQLKLDTEIDANINAQEKDLKALSATMNGITPPAPIAHEKKQAAAKASSYALPINEPHLPLELKTPPISGPLPSILEEKKGTNVPIPAHVDEGVIEFNFEDADLQNLLDYISLAYDVTFITNDALTPLPKNAKALKGNKISFKTHNPMSKKEAWNVFVSFLDLAGFTIVPEFDPKFYKIMQTDAARKAPLPVYIGIKPDLLPKNDQVIRYVYFVENANLKTIDDMVNTLRSPASAFVPLPELNAFLLTDKSYNIISLMNIITELDRTSLPQSMSVLKLRRADALEVKALYDSIIQADDASITARLFPARKQSTTLYFPENTRVIAEPRSNALILLGPQDAIKKIEDFITTYVDVELGKPHSPLRTYQLKYADANTVAAIMNDVTQFGKNKTVGQVGGVLDGDKYLKNITFTPEPATNTLIIRGDEEDYVRAKEIIAALDESQPQIAMEVLILSIDIGEAKILGTQLRNKIPGIDGLVGPNVDFQNSGSRISGVPAGIVPNTTGTGAERLLGNLINLAAGAIPGNTVVSLGVDRFGIWGIFNILHTLSNTQIISNPFIVTTNKKKARVSVGETRRVVTGQTVGATTAPVNSFGNQDANLSVDVTPQINSDGMIVLDLDINLDVFTNNVDLSSATKTTKQVKTTTIVADKEVLALGGLVQNRVDTGLSKIPILGSIPVIGWLFKNKSKTDAKTNLLILISTRIVQPEMQQMITSFTQDRVNEYREDLDLMQEKPDRRDPIHRWYFADEPGSSDEMIDEFIFKRHKKRSKKKKNNNNLAAAKLPTNKELSQHKEKTA